MAGLSKLLHVYIFSLLEMHVTRFQEGFEARQLLSRPNSPPGIQRYMSFRLAAPKVSFA